MANIVDVVLIFDNPTIENGLYYLEEYLKTEYKAVSIKYNDLKNVIPKLIITNIHQIINACKQRIFFISTEDNLGVLRKERRILINNLKRCNEIFVYSRESQKFFEQVRIKTTIQYPYIPPHTQAKRKHILYHNIPSPILSQIDADWIKFEDYGDLNTAKLLVYRPTYNETFNTLLPLASSCGIPCVLEESGCLVEFAHNGADTILSKSSSERQWINAIKEAMRDNNQRSKKSKDASARFSNLSNINHKIKNALGKNMPASQLPSIASNLLQKRAKERKDKLKKEKLLSDLKKRQKNTRPKQKKQPYTSVSDIRIKETPTWFLNNKNVDVSIIIPLYKSEKVIADQIREWNFFDDKLSKEIIYVDNNCPSMSGDIIVREWEKQRSKLGNNAVGKIIKSDKNIGYGPANNVGAYHALGEYLIFLNADCIVTQNWIRPMYDLLEDNPEIGITGNIQLKKDGTIDSAGSEYSWGTGNFEHVARNVLNGQRISRPLTPKTLPKELKRPIEREMVTGCCFMIKRDVFFEAEGFDHNYQYGYWEDTDLNMKARDLGYKIMLQPKSVVYHVGGHSGVSGGHDFKKANKNRFHGKWINTGKIDRFIQDKRKHAPSVLKPKENIKGKVVGCTIACNEEEFLELAIDSIAPVTDEYIIVVGGNEYAVASGMCHPNGTPKDDTLDIAYSLQEKYNVKVIPPPGRPWKSKIEMRNAYAKYLNQGEWMFMVDADEVYSKEQLWRVSQLMKGYEVLILQFYLFWNNMQTVGTGSWDKYPQERVVRWRQGYHYKHPNHLNVADNSGNPACHKVPTYKGKERLFYHYAYVRPIEKISQKIEYYKHQLAKEWGQKNSILNNYMENIYLKWREDPLSVKETHPRGGGGAAFFTGMHPASVAKLMLEGKFNF